MIPQLRPLIEVFSDIPDVHTSRGKRHPLSALLALSCCAMRLAAGWLPSRRRHWLSSVLNSKTEWPWGRTTELEVGQETGDDTVMEHPETMSGVVYQAQRDRAHLW